jgi:hypothetical protein
MQTKNLRVCSFCWRTSKEVDLMVAGPDMVNICEDCIEVCVRIIAERKNKLKEKSTTDEIQNKPRSALVDRMRRLNMGLDNNYREKLSSLYFELEDVLGKMDIALEGAEDHPAELTKDDALSTRTFLREADRLIESYFELFVKLSDE